MDKVREELICAVCLDFLREPKVLECAHSFCSQCLRGVAKGRTRLDPAAERRTSASLDLECPSCRHVTVLEHGRVDLDLPTNANLKRLVEFVSDEEKGRTLKVWPLWYNLGICYVEQSGVVVSTYCGCGDSLTMYVVCVCTPVPCPATFTQLYSSMHSSQVSTQPLQQQLDTIFYFFRAESVYGHVYISVCVHIFEPTCLFGETAAQYTRLEC